MRKLFYALFALPLLFAACEPDTPAGGDNPGGDNPGGGEEPKKEYALEHNFDMAAYLSGEELDIELDENQLLVVFGNENDEEADTMGAAVFNCKEAVTALPAGTYKIADNTLMQEGVLAYLGGEDIVIAKESVIVVKLNGQNYDIDWEFTATDDKLYHFTFKGEIQSFEMPEEEDFTPVKVVAEKYETGNFFLQLYIDGTYYHELDMYDVIDPNDNYLSAGMYMYSDESIGSWSTFCTGGDQTCGLADAVITLSHNEGETSIYGFIESEEGVTLNIDWTGVVEGFNFGGDEPGDSEYDVVFVASYAGGTHYNVGMHNYYFVVSDVEITGQPTSGGTYYYFDFYHTDADEYLNIPNGVYTFDLSNSYASGTFTEEYSYGFLVDGASAAVWYLYDEGSTVTITDGKLVADLILQDGTRHKVTFEGSLSLSDIGGGGAEGDIEFNETGYTVYAEYYDQYYSDETDNWLIYLYEDIETGNGGFFTFDLLADYATSTDYRGTFTASNDLGINTFIPGYIDEGYLVGAWYAELTDGAATGLMVPMVEGYITITFNDDGTQTFEFDCYDDQGNHITGSVSGAPMADEYSALSKSFSVGKRGFELKKSIVF